MNDRSNTQQNAGSQGSASNSEVEPQTPHLESGDSDAGNDLETRQSSAINRERRETDISPEEA